MKTINIDGKAFEIDSNALTIVKYNTFFKTGILADMQKLEIYLAKQQVYTTQFKEAGLSDVEVAALVSEKMRDEVDEFVIKLTQIAWILIYSANEKIEPYEEWLKNIKHFKFDDKWISEVTEFAVNSFCESEIK